MSKRAELYIQLVGILLIFGAIILMATQLYRGMTKEEFEITLIPFIIGMLMVLATDNKEYNKQK